MTGRAGAISSAFGRLARLEAAHPDLLVVRPGTPTSWWVAAFPAGTDRQDPERITVSCPDLQELMGELDEIYPPDGGDTQ